MPPGCRSENWRKCYTRSGYDRKDQCHTKAGIQIFEYQTFVVIRLTGPKQYPAVSPDHGNQFFKKTLDFLGNIVPLRKQKGEVQLDDPLVRGDRPWFHGWPSRILKLFRKQL